jgi:hypothetical protein
MALILTATVSMTVYAVTGTGGGPGQPENPIPDGITKEQWDKLNDQTVTFDELPYRVRYFNPSMLNNVDNMESFVKDNWYIYNEMLGVIRDLDSKLEDMEDAGIKNTKPGLDYYNDLNVSLKKLRKEAGGLKRSTKMFERSDSSLNSSIAQITKNYTYYANQLMIGYNNAVSSQAMLEKMVELSSQAVEAQELCVQLGTVTQTEVLKARKDLLSAQSSLMKVNHMIDTLRQSLCLMTGYSADENLQIGSLPQLDLEKLSSINLKEDTRKAIGNNYELIDTRHASSGKGTTKVNLKKDTVSEGEQNLTIQMQAFYQSIQQSKTAYEAACTSYDRAAIKKRSADLSYQMGKISKLNYLQAEMAFLQAESGKQSAYNNLYQAYDTYQWAIKGIIISDS